MSEQTKLVNGLTDVEKDELNVLLDTMLLRGFAQKGRDER